MIASQRLGHAALPSGDLGQPVADIGNAVVDKGGIGVVARLLGAVVDPDRGHAERLGRDRGCAPCPRRTGRAPGAMRVALAHRRIGARIGLGDIVHGVDVVEPVEGVGEAEPVEHAPRIGLVAVGEDELAPRQPVERRRPAAGRR